MLVLAVLAVRTSDEIAPLGTRSGLTIWSLPSGLARDKAALQVEEAVRSANVSFAKVDERTEGGRAVRILRDLGSTGGPRQHDCPSVPSSVPTRCTWDEGLPPSSVEGTYMSADDRSRLEPIERSLVAKGFQVSTQSTSVVQLALWMLDDLPVLPVVLVTALGTVSATVHRAWLHRRADALSFVHGASRGQIVRRHVGRVASVLLVSGAACAVLVGLSVLVVVGSVAVPLAVGVVATAVLTLVAVLVPAHAIVTLGSLRTDPRGALAGARPARGRSVTAGVLHGATLVLLAALGVAVWHQAVLLLGAQQERSTWSAARQWHTLSLVSTGAESDESDDDFARLVHDMDVDGDAIIAMHPTGETEGYGAEHGHSLIVNARWLDEQDVRGVDGKSWGRDGAHPDALVLLVPAALASVADDVAREWEEWITFMAESPDALGPVDAETPVVVVPVADGESVFDYGTGPGDDQSTSTGGVVAVLPTGGPLLSDNWTVAALTQGQVLFSDVPLLERRLAETGLADQVQRIDRAADLATTRLDRQARLLGDVLVLGVLAVAVALGTAVAYAGSIAERSRRREALLRVWGASPLRRTGPALAGVGLVAGLALVVVRIIGPWDPVPAVTVAVLDVVVVTALLLVARTRTSSTDPHRS